ncbi:exocyst complex component 6B isoform X3 [Hydra vulgaris]|uniref:Exocyst complex component n=1 Tax=Hydra vulgaris TaxID=6087 RepID=A0ABM4BKP8_HYDVU
MAVDQRLDSLIGEIESSDSPIGPVLRSVYEDDSQLVFLQKLDDRSKLLEKEIERMCSFHYQGFVESVNELIRVRTEASRLKILLKKANSDLQESGTSLLCKLKDLTELRLRNRNMVDTMEVLSLCIPVLEMYAKLYEQKKNKRYYPALKTLEQLEHTYLARIKHFRFAELMISKLPFFRDSIKDAAKEDLMLFLESVRSKSEKLGEIVMKQVHQQYSLSLLHGVDEGVAEEKNEILQICCTDLIDFSPVYRCMHIFSALSQRDIFEHYYRKERMQQARLAFDWQRATVSIHESFHIFQTYFYQIVGFFVVEDTVMTTAEGLVTRGTVEELWEIAVSKIGTVLQKQCSNLEDSSMMLKIKELLVWFSHTLYSYGFSVNALYDVLLQMRDRYNEMLTKNWRPVFDEIGKEDNFTPLYITTLEEFNSILQDYPFNIDVPLDEFPKKFPFSWFVPKVYSEMKRFIEASMKFNENLNISRTETDSSIRKSTNLLLTKTLSESVKKLLSHPALNLAQLAQMSVNTMHLEDACPELEEFISDVTGTTDVNVSLTRLYGTSTFKDIRADAEMRIYEKLNQKMDDFLGLANYNWCPTNVRTHPSSYLMDLLAYLQGAFITFEPLPGDIAKTACMSSCKHLASNLKMFLLDEKVKALNMNGLLCFEIDLKQCEAFATSTPVQGFGVGTLEMTFQELRQIVDLFVKGDWSAYLHDRNSASNKYNRVQPSTALILLEKMNDTSKKINFKKADREKKKFIENLTKRLRDMI